MAEVAVVLVLLTEVLTEVMLVMAVEELVAVQTTVTQV
jgi:hypothetical protein